MNLNKTLFYTLIIACSFLLKNATAESLANDDPEFLIEETISSEQQEEIPPVDSVEETEISELPSYTWAQFLNGEPCSDLIGALSKQSFLSQEQTDFLGQLNKYCLSKGNTWISLLSTFRQNKKALLINEVQKHNSIFIRYLFEVFYSLVDLHKQEPTGDNIYAQLDKIENAIQDKNLEQIYDLLQTFSTEQMVFLTPFSNEVNQLIQFKENL